MTRERLQPTMTWAEDRATQRCDPSAAPGAKIEGRALFFQKDAAHLLLRDWHQSEKPSRPEAVILPTRCRPLLANLKPSRFQFTVNQDISYFYGFVKVSFRIQLSNVGMAVA